MLERGDIGDIDGKTVLVTGASSGIGLTACVELARRGAKIILSGRNPEKTAGSAEQVRAEAKYPDAVSVELCDMADLSDIRALGERLRTRLPSLDVLVNNAGAMHTHRKTTADGFEMTYGVNHLGYFLTTLELLPLLQSAPAARVVNVASDAHRAARLDLNDVGFERRGYSAWAAYGTSKLLNILFTKELSERLSQTNISANSLHPGVVRTGFAHNDPGWMSTVWRWSGVFQISAEKGAETTVYLACSPEVAGTSGGYFARCRLKRPRRLAERADLARELWELSARQVGASDHHLPRPV